MNKRLMMVMSFALILLTACDPTYPIIIDNTTNKPVSILVKKNNHFRTEKEKTTTTPDGFDVYRLDPNELISVGTAIAELDDYIPFNVIKIVKDGDTLSAFNLVSIKELFEKKAFGKLRKPYQILIK